MKNYLKRFSVSINGLLYAAFENEQDARQFIAQRWGSPEIATIYDHEKQDCIYTEVRI